VILLIFLLVALVVALLTGGRLTHLAETPIRLGYLILVALWLQIMIFSTWWQAGAVRAGYTGPLYILSLAILLWAVWLNRHVPGILVIGAGLLLNALVIVANGGAMPASLDALKAAGILQPDATFESLRVTNSSLIQEGTPLWFLGDIFAVPGYIPLANVFSAGDIVIGVGGFYFLLANSRPREQAA
jgi:hypothetical protein